MSAGATVEPNGALTVFDRPALGGAEHRVVTATLSCIGRWGLAKTTLDDVAREAGVSRATVYRLFPGGKPALLQASGIHELCRLLTEVTGSVAQAESLEELLNTAMVGAARWIRHNAPLQMLMRHEPEVLLPFLAFDRQGPLLNAAVIFLASSVERFTTVQVAEDAVEWMTRLVISYTFTPSQTVDLTREADVARLISTHVLPGIRLAESQSTPTANKFPDPIHATPQEQ